MTSTTHDSVAAPVLTDEERDTLKTKKAFHILKAFLEVTEHKTKHLADLYDDVYEAYVRRLDADPSVTDNVRPHFLLSKKSALTGKNIWDRSKQYKANFLNIYNPNMPKVSPSGSNHDDLFEICRRNSWVEIQKKAKKTVCVDDCPSTWAPVDWWAFQQLHDHPKFKAIDLSDEAATAEIEPAEKLVAQVASRKQQRMKSRTKNRKNFDAAQHIANFNSARVDLCCLQMDMKEISMALKLGRKTLANELFDDYIANKRAKKDRSNPIAVVNIDTLTSEEVSDTTPHSSTGTD